MAGTHHSVFCSFFVQGRGSWRLCAQVTTSDNEIKQILHNISFEIDCGSMFAIMGPSGTARRIHLPHLRATVSGMQDVLAHVLDAECPDEDEAIVDADRIGFLCPGAGKSSLLKIIGGFNQVGTLTASSLAGITTDDLGYVFADDVLPVLDTIEEVFTFYAEFVLPATATLEEKKVPHSS
jgi:ABC-type nitrate/sulfonate/bicarbonate transport system ATPase subunit